METAIALMSALGLNGIMLFLVKRYFDRRDKARADDAKAGADLRGKIENALETIRLLSYARMSQEIERLLDQGYATPAERRVLDEMFANYKAHGWNGDMDARLEKVYRLRTDRPDE
ncbi:hypothetical protein [Pseudoflavonifractor sp. MCC625]|uniref:hypothetical protein n=1 Tax=Pseudoflavonifractor sp. MCC625 TaxID=2592647 RepID=UPI001C031297|nr:hypothetical protein [Pseudoflavonifractor sp. MCC625]MBT9685686.1 hypothetical protein [Pseudoflavonifractor sp. MCC625]